MPRSTPNLFVLAIAIVTAALAAAIAPSRHFNAESANGTILYVDDDAPANGDGLTWRQAFRHLQDALDAARRPNANVAEIRVARGVYKPDQGANVTPGDIHASFDLIGGLALCGGYAGYYAAHPAALTATTAHDPDARDFQKFETILSGDLLGNDAPNWQNMDDNSRNVVKLTNVSAVLIEGMSVVGGKASGDSESGGGILAENSALRLTGCVVRDCQASLFGGGARALECDLMISNCRFVRNTATYGGGAWLEDGTIVVVDSQFVHNRAGQFTGGLNISSSSVMPQVQSCVFRENFATISSAGASGGGLWTDCLFEANACEDRYGGGSFAGTLQRCVFRNNLAGFEGAGAALVGFGPNWIVDCAFEGNQQWETGGAGVITRGFSTTKHHFVNCKFLGNSGNDSEALGGGALIQSGTSTFTNCLFSGNSSAGGGAISVGPNAVSVRVINSTFFGNDAWDSDTGAIAGPFTARNCIFWNSTPTHFGSVPEPDVEYSCVEGEFQGPPGIITLDPMFVNPTGADGILGTRDDDLGLTDDSPCIDAGKTSELPADLRDIDNDGDTQELLPVDLAGAPRLRNAPSVRDSGIASPCETIVDMGAYEFQPASLVGDVNGDTSVNVDDLIAVILSWGACQPSNCPDACPADVVPPPLGDGAVNALDLFSVIFNWS